MSGSDFLVLLMEATAQAGCDRPLGSIHKIIAVVAAPTYEEARETTLQKLADGFWSDIQFRRYGPLVVETANPNYLQRAITDAHEHGIGIVVYETKH